MDLGLTEAQEILKTTAANFLQQEYPKETVIALESTPTGMTPELFRKVAVQKKQYEIPAPTLERVLRTFQDTDPSTKKAVFAALEEILESGANEEQLLAAVKTLCPGRGTPSPTNQFQEVPAAV